MDKHMGFNEQISEEAAGWLVEFRTGDIDAAGRREFDTWLRASPEHLRAFIEMAALWNETGAVDTQHRLDITAVIARSAGEQQVIALAPKPAQGQRDGPPYSEPEAPSIEIHQTRRPAHRNTLMVSRKKLATAASLVTLAVAAALIPWSNPFGPPTYHTQVGEHQSFRLPDGSRVVLDSRSRLRVVFTAANRQVELLEGQALFYVVRNAQRPFLVRVGGAVVRDIGTQFDVDRQGDGAVVTVVEGQVSVTTPPTRQLASAAPNETLSSSLVRASIQPVLLRAGEQLDVGSDDRSPRPIHVNVSSVTAWTQGRLVLEAATLSQVAEAFNRYSARELVAHDNGSRPLHLSGVFVTNPKFLIRYLRERSDITVTETDSEIDIVRNDRASGESP